MNTVFDTYRQAAHNRNTRFHEGQELHMVCSGVDS